MRNECRKTHRFKTRTGIRTSGEHPKLYGILMLCVSILCNHSVADSETVYFEDFEQSIGQEWSSSKTVCCLRWNWTFPD